MRFTDGLWESRNGYKLHRAHSLWEWRAEKDQVHFMVPCTEIRSLRDTIAGPVLHFTITAPKAEHTGCQGLSFYRQKGVRAIL